MVIMPLGWDGRVFETVPPKGIAVATVSVGFQEELSCLVLRMVMTSVSIT